MITEYQSNSHKSKVQEQEPMERKKAQKVVSGKVTKKKKGTAARLADVFLPGDITDVKKHIFMDVLVPALKNLALSVINDGASMLITGDAKYLKNGTSGSKTSYNTIFAGRNAAGGSQIKYQTRTVYDYDNIVFETSGEANLVLDQLEDHINRFNEVTVGDFYDMAGIIPEHTDYNYGWKNVAQATVVGTRDGYIIRLPKAVALKH